VRLGIGRETLRVDGVGGCKGRWYGRWVEEGDLK
jgi:hypothetical protein